MRQKQKLGTLRDFFDISCREDPHNPIQLPQPPTILLLIVNID